ncbi:MAG TPA: nucleotidyl transferase AbiEii/AbiGii toxin family protein [Pyrinomonadaceae bacterium]|nr:nucleotidyl transferase AbiEii/AbiGii toxin family protein [Pyrinomonadaceae bacterium]
MNGVLSAAAEVQAFCDGQGWQFCFIGGIALQRWAEPRETIDVDLTLFTGFGNEDGFIDRLLERFEARIDAAGNFARERRVLLLRSRDGAGIDIAMGALPFEELMISRSSEFAFPGEIKLRTCSAEDLIVLKAFAGRPQDWIDVERTIVRQTGKLDWEYVLDQLQPLAELKDAPHILEALEQRRIEFEK